MKFIFKLITSLKKWRSKRQLKCAIAEAKRMSLAENGKQYHVIENPENRKLIVVSNEFLKKNGYVKISGINRRRIALYSTPIDRLLKRLDDLKRKSQL